MFDGFVNNNNWTNFVYVISYYLEKILFRYLAVIASSFLLREW